MFELQLAKIWEQALEITKHDVSKPTFDTWFKDTELIAYYGDTLVIKTPNEFCKNTLENSYYHVLKQNLEDLLEHSIKIKFVTPKEAGADTLSQTIVSSQISQQPAAKEISPAQPLEVYQQDLDFSNYNLNPKYTFDSFVIGKGNNFAYAACEAVANNIISNFSSKRTYNPLFIYGNPGLGKTHLMQATAHAVLQHNKNIKVIYISSEKFMNEFIDCIKNNTMPKFRDKYRNVDILLIDDIQFLKNKEGTQEEFFHTFNTLYEANKQIIISSDRQPKEIPTLEERLRTRFEWGLITDIQAPDFETRVAILLKKAQSENLEVPDDVTYYIAENIQSNIRELEGVLVRLVAFSSLNHLPIDLNLAKDCLQSIIPVNNTTVITPEIIKQKVADIYNIKVDEFSAKKRNRNIAYPRQIAMYLCRDLTDLSLPKIGEYFGGRDHSTVIHACERITSDMKTDLSLQATINNIKNQLTGNN